MASPFRVRDIVRSNEKLGLKLGHGGTILGDYVCAIGAIGCMVFGVDQFEDMYHDERRPKLAEKLGVPLSRIDDIEIGYEGCSYGSRNFTASNKRYEKVGEKLREYAKRR